MIAGGPIWTKLSWLATNIPTHDTWLSSRIIFHPNFEFSFAHASSDALSDEVPSLSELALSKRLVYHFPYINFHFV